jgi:hypothetical protein
MTTRSCPGRVALALPLLPACAQAASASVAATVGERRGLYVPGSAYPRRYGRWTGSGGS